MLSGLLSKYFKKRAARRFSRMTLALSGSSTRAATRFMTLETNSKIAVIKSKSVMATTSLRLNPHLGTWVERGVVPVPPRFPVFTIVTSPSNA